MPPENTEVPPETTGVRPAMRRTAIRLVAWVVLLALVSAGVGLAVAGASGLLGALLGVGLTALFGLGDVGIMWATSHRPVAWTSGALIGGWLAKLAVVLGVTLWVRGDEAVSTTMYVVTVGAGVIGAVVVELVVSMRARVPYVDARHPGL